jgi:hypothetical protein
MATLAQSHLDQEQVQLAWGVYRALLLAENEDPKLADNPGRMAKISAARFRFQSVYDEWCRQ